MAKASKIVFLRLFGYFMKRALSSLVRGPDSDWTAPTAKNNVADSSVNCFSLFYERSDAIFVSTTRELVARRQNRKSFSLSAISTIGTRTIAISGIFDVLNGCTSLIRQTALTKLPQSISISFDAIIFCTYVYKTASSSHNPSENLNFDGRLCLENEISVR